MMKNDKPIYTEIENLSAYLDHELSEVEENQLRGRLAHDAKLREQLEDLRLTRYTLRHTPKIQRQRSFTLSPEVVKKQKFAWTAINFSRMVAAAASVLFALVVGGEVLFGSSGGMLASAPAENAVAVQDSAEMGAPMAMEVAPEEAVEEAAPMEALMVEPAEEPAPEEPAADIAPGGKGGGVEITPTMQGTPEPGGGGGALPTLEATEFGIGGGMPPTETPEAAMEERIMPSEKVLGETEQLEPEMPPDAAAEGDSFGTASSQMAADDELSQSGSSSESQQPQIPLIRWVQGGLLVLALLGGGAAIYFRKTIR